MWLLPNPIAIKKRGKKKCTFLIYHLVLQKREGKKKSAILVLAQELNYTERRKKGGISILRKRGGGGLVRGKFLLSTSSQGKEKGAILLREEKGCSRPLSNSVTVYLIGKEGRMISVREEGGKGTDEPPLEKLTRSVVLQEEEKGKRDTTSSFTLRKTKEERTALDRLA